VNPDTLVLDKATGRIRDQTLGDKAVMSAATEDGTGEVAVDAARRGAAVLDAAAAAELARLATLSGC
jgi:pyruvate,water dikinase